MCGRYTETQELAKLQDRFRFGPPTFKVKPRYNIAPTQDAPVVLLSGETGSQRKLEMFRWGLVPVWAKELKIGNQLINARGETVAEKPAFRDSFKKRRCLILADGFYEWREVEPKVKAPMRIRLKTGEPFAFAGLWDRWKNPEGTEVRTFTIITTSASKSLKSLHDRMPVMLRPEQEDDWLDPAAEASSLQKLIKPFEDVEYYPVSPAVNTPKNDVPELIRPI
jgi:putative SOS response-associated peptidase YedK